MEKEYRKEKLKEKNTKSIKKEKSPKIFTTLLSFIAIPGSHLLSSTFGSISHSVSRSLSEYDKTILNTIDNFNGFYEPYAPVSSDPAYYDRYGDGVDISRALPSEMLYSFASYLHSRDCLNLILVNKLLNQTPIWRRYCADKGVENCSSFTTTECKKLLFDGHWTLTREVDYICKKKPCRDIWRLRAIPLDIYLQNYHYYLAHENGDIVVVFVVDVSKYDVELTEPDGTKINYMDKCRQVLEQIATGPYGPITKSQFKLAANRKKGLGRIWQDFYQPYHFPYIVISFVGQAEFKEKVLQDPNFPVVIHQDDHYVQHFQQLLLSTIRSTDAFAYVCWADPTFAIFTHYCQHASFHRGLIEYGIIKQERNF